MVEYTSKVLFEVYGFIKICWYFVDNNNNNNNNNNNDNNNKNNNNFPVTLKYRLGVWPGIVVSHGQEGLFSLGWQPS